MLPLTVSTALLLGAPPVSPPPASTVPPALPSVTAPANVFWLPVPLSPQIVPPLSVHTLLKTLDVLKKPSTAPEPTVTVFVGSPNELVLVWNASTPWLIVMLP